MLFTHIISVLIMVTGIFQKATSQLKCQRTQYYNEKENDCCFRCPQGLVTHSSCVRNINKECATCSGPNKFIIWSQNHPTCGACRMCRAESFLVEIQKCSLLTEAICQCKPGFYCHTPLHNSCARCNPFNQCPPGQGVKQKGSPEKDTECEACPSGMFSDVYSTTETCKSHTDCNKLHQVTTRKGSATADALCGEPIDPVLVSSGNYTVKTYTRYAATTDTTTPHTSTTDTTTSGPFISTTNGAANKSGEWSTVYVIATIICVISLLLAFLLTWKQICNLKLFKNFFQLELSEKAVKTNMEEHNEDNLLQWEKTPETYQRTEITQTEWTMEDKYEMQQGRDQMNNRIEKIFIMNAETVLVGSISEVPTRCRSLTADCDSCESVPLASCYPEQESSKLSANDLMISIEEEERDSCSAKALLEV